jgi:methylmalonyl-CoA/ethylmalonyl-CoA epimerase
MSGNILKIDHLGIAVNDLDESIALYTRLFGREPDSIEDVPDQKVRTAFFAAGESNVELLFPTHPDSPIARFLDKRGPGIHHVCFGVPDIEARLRDFEAQGIVLIDHTPRLGAHRKRIAFLHPKSTGGVLMELSEGADAHSCSRPPPRPHGG